MGGNGDTGTLSLIRRRALLPHRVAIHHPNAIPGPHCSANMYTRAASGVNHPQMTDGCSAPSRPVGTESRLEADFNIPWGAGS